MTQPENIVKANSVIDVKVKSPAKENLGKIEEIMIDKLSGKVNYVVMSFGGILGMGEKLFALPWRSISFSPEDNCFILNLDKEILKNAPGFDKNNWPNMADPLWEQTIKSYYGMLDNVKDKAKDKLSDLADRAEETVEETSKDIQKSTKDLVGYMQAHPAQSILFGILGCFAVKGIMK